MLAPIRRVVPLVGMFDFSPLILMILIELVDWLLTFILRSLERLTMSKKDFHLHDGKRGSAIAIPCDTARQQQQNCRGAERWDGEDPPGRRRRWITKRTIN